MKRESIFVLTIILTTLILFIIPFSQACVTLNTFKTEFLPQETMQMEVNVDYGQQLVKDIYTSDLFLYKDNQLVNVDYFITKVSSNKFFVWFNVPGEGDYTFKVRASCTNGFIFVPTTFHVNEPKSFYYDSVKSQVDGKWQNLKLDEITLASAALSYDEGMVDDALEAYFSRQDSCINTNCSTKNASLAIISFKDFSTRSQIKNLLDAYQNNLKGTWQLGYNSSYSQDCNLTIGNNTRTLNIFSNNNLIDIDLSSYNGSVVISDNCNLTDRKIIFKYQDMSKNFTIANNYLASNLGCFGNNLKSACDPESTAYALFSMYIAGFDINDKDNVVAWLSSNANAIDQVAIAYLFTKEQGKLNQVLASQTYNGAWQKQGTSDLQATVTIYYILNQVENKTGYVLDAIDKAKSYIASSLDSASLSDKSYALFVVFPNLEPLMSVWPGIVKTSSGSVFNLLLQNNGAQDIDSSISMLNSSFSSNVPKNSIKNLQIYVPMIETPNGDALTEILSIQYSNDIINSMTKTYNIPVIIFTLKGNESHGNFTINQSQINQNQTQGIINGTMNNSLMNRTIELNESLIKENFYFSESNITRTISSSGLFSINVELVNNFPDSVTDILLQPSATFRLSDIQFSLSRIDELEGNETDTIIIYIDPTKINERVDGTLEATGDYNGQEINAILYLNFISNINNSNNEQTCEDKRGHTCFENQTCRNNNITSALDTQVCCLSSCDNATSSNSKVVAIIIIFVVVLILLGVLLYLRRKPKQDKEFLENVSKEIKPYDDEEFRQPRSKDFREEFGSEFPEGEGKSNELNDDFQNP
jgi:hypothetical protein